MVTDQVVQAVGRVGVDEAVTNPLSGPDGLANGSNVVNGSLDAILIGFAVVDAIDIVLSRVTKDIEGIFTSQGYQLSRLRPVDL